MYDLHKILISDNKSSFCRRELKWINEELHIEHQFNLVHGPQTSDQVEIDNKLKRCYLE